MLSDLLTTKKKNTVVIPQLEVISLSNASQFWFATLLFFLPNTTSLKGFMMSKMISVTNHSFSVILLCISVAYRCAWAAQTHSAASWQAQQIKCTQCCRIQHVKQGRRDGILDTMCLLGSLRWVRACKNHLIYLLSGLLHSMLVFASAVISGLRNLGDVLHWDNFILGNFFV